jgi:F-type H+-transporting ATPase subunit a
MVEQQIGAKGRVYFPFIYVLFVFILIANLLGNIPYSFAITSHLILTIGMSVMILIGVTILGFKHHQLEFFSLFCPVGTPLALVPLLVLIEVVSYLARSVSLGLRLGANIMAGHMLMIILGGFIYQIFMMTILGGIIPFIIVIGITGLELAISIIQSYVFVILTCSYIKDAIELH